MLTTEQEDFVFEMARTGNLSEIPEARADKTKEAGMIERWLLAASGRFDRDQITHMVNVYLRVMKHYTVTDGPAPITDTAA